MKICLINIATNKYIDFIPQLWQSVNNNFLTEHEVESLLFTNNQMNPLTKNGKVAFVEHYPFPVPSLMRYHYILSESEYLSDFDYCFYIDVDMKVVSKIGDEILGDLVVVKHPGKWNKDNMEFPYERRKQSSAYIPYGEGNMYYQNAFNGGKTKNFLSYCQSTALMIDQDIAQNITAEIYDESYMNKYMLKNPPTIELSPSYCYPQDFTYASQVAEFEPKIIALDKNHEFMRS